MLDFEYARSRMVDLQIVRRGVHDERVLAAMRVVPREQFVAPEFEEFAYDDAPLPISEEQTISQPYIVAVMLEAAALELDDRVLEVGAGSGYAAAVASRIVREVYAVERHEPLGRQAKARLGKLGYDNVHLSVGDGTRGWPDAAPFDAILVAAGGPSVPHALREQLEVGGRLIMPVGDDRSNQRLLRVTRISATRFEEEDLGGVRFVPLIGAEGWNGGHADAGAATDPPTHGEPKQGKKQADRPPPAASRPLPAMIRDAAEPLPDLDDPNFAAAFDRFGDRRVVLLGEASHGTSEFYRARAAITKRLVERHGFGIVAVEADWPDAAAIDRFVGHRGLAPDQQPPFDRFPTWMWRNTDVASFVDWLRTHNGRIAEPDRVAFYGLDIYNMSAAIAAVLRYLDDVDPEAAATARERYGCLTPWQKEPSTYGRAVLGAGYRRCEEAVVAQCRELLARRLDYEARDGGAFLDAAQNARLVASAEQYYRVMYYGGARSWNLRDRHMFETLRNVLDSRGSGARAVVWAHNSHIGDARHTEMGLVRDELNLGQLCREAWGDAAALVGFGTHAGTVAAAHDWDGPMEVMKVNPSHAESYERLCHDSGVPRFLLDMRRIGPLAQRLEDPRLERFIGVIYRPGSELMSHYAEASLPRQFDAYVWFDHSRAVTPLTREHLAPGLPDTYPFGL